MFHACERFLFPAKGLECLSFEVQKILFRCRRLSRHIAAAQHVRELARDEGFVICDVAGLFHQVDAEFHFCRERLSKYREIRRRRWTIACCRQRHDHRFRIMNEPVRIHRDSILGPQI